MLEGARDAISASAYGLRSDRARELLNQLAINANTGCGHYDRTERGPVRAAFWCVAAARRLQAKSQGGCVMIVVKLVRGRKTRVSWLFAAVCCLLAIAAGSIAGSASAESLSEPELGRCTLGTEGFPGKYANEACTGPEGSSKPYLWKWEGVLTQTSFEGGPVVIGKTGDPSVRCATYRDAPDYGSYQSWTPATEHMIHLSAPTLGLIMEGCEVPKTGAECHSEPHEGFGEPPEELVQPGVIWTNALQGEMNFITPGQVGFSLEGQFLQEFIIAYIVCTEVKGKKTKVTEMELGGTGIGEVVSPRNLMTLLTEIRFESKGSKQNPEKWQGKTRQNNHFAIQRWTDDGAVRSGKPKRTALTFTLHGENQAGLKMEIRTEK